MLGQSHHNCPTQSLCGLDRLSSLRFEGNCSFQSQTHFHSLESKMICLVARKSLVRRKKMLGVREEKTLIDFAAAGF